MAAAVSSGFVPMAVPGQVDIYALSENTKHIKEKLRDITNEAFKDYYKPAPKLRAYYEDSYRVRPPVYVYHAPWYAPTHTTIINNNNGGVQTTIINNNNGGSVSSRSSRRDNSNDALLGIVGVIITLVGAYLLGVEVKKHKVAEEGLQTVKELKKEIKNISTEQETKDILDSGKRFFKKMERDSYTWLIIKATVVAGGILLAAGGFASIGGLLAAGAIVTTLGLAAAAVRWGFTLGDDAKMSSLAQKILNIN